MEVSRGVGNRLPEDCGEHRKPEEQISKDAEPPVRRLKRKVRGRQNDDARQTTAPTMPRL